MNARSLIEAIHRSPMKAALVLTGGGTTAAGQLLSVPGGSRTILEVAVPYHESALCEYLGFRPEQFCSADTAAALAERALDRARALAPGDPLAGLGATASLATDRPKKGSHRFHLAAATDQAIAVLTLVFQKGARDREGEAAVLDAVLLNQLAETFGVSERLPAPLLPGEALQLETRSTGSLLAKLSQGEVPCVCVEFGGRLRVDAEKPRLLLPGAFNPLHEAHRRLAQVAANQLKLAPAFELSVLNVDKPALAAEEVGRRARQFHWLAPLWLTRAATFAEKAMLFPNAVFVVGIDTAARIVDPRYYHDKTEAMAESLARIRSQGCRFLVAGRRDGPRLRSLDDAELPKQWRDLFTAIPESDFHYDLSSTELRQREDRP